MNPYDFVRLPDRVQRERVFTHERLRGHSHGARSGRIYCRLTAETPIFIPATGAGAGVQHFMSARYNGADIPVIPGSSLKGVIRCVAEAVSPSCIGLSGELIDRPHIRDNRRRIRDEYHGAIPEVFVTCDVVSRLCPACRLFGMVSPTDHFLGKVSISDAHAQTGRFSRCDQMILKPLMGPNPRHTAFYVPNGKVAGRKFYFHHSRPPKTVLQATGHTKTIVPLAGGVDAEGNPRTTFEFQVAFSNVTEEEYSLLLFSLVLTEGMRHKIGGGKPLGLGTVRIEATEIVNTDASRRYRGLNSRDAGAIVGTTLAGDSLRTHLRDATASITTRPSPSLEDLQYIWRYPPDEDEDYIYPDQEWFNDGDNSQLPLSETP